MASTASAKTSADGLGGDSDFAEAFEDNCDLKREVEEDNEEVKVVFDEHEPFVWGLGNSMEFDRKLFKMNLEYGVVQKWY